MGTHPLQIAAPVTASSLLVTYAHPALEIEGSLARHPRHNETCYAQFGLAGAPKFAAGGEDLGSLGTLGERHFVQLSLIHI